MSLFDPWDESSTVAVWMTPESLASSGFKNSILRGSISDVRIAANFYESRLENPEFVRCFFDRTDLRDCQIKQGKFNDCKFTTGTIIGTTFIRCTFEDTQIDSYAIHDCFFIDCSFVNCKVMGSMIRYSPFMHCDFSALIGSNRVFDECLFQNSRFRDSAIDMDIVLNNFGLTIEWLTSDQLKAKETTPNATSIAKDSNILDHLESATHSAISRFRFDYYKIGTLNSPRQSFQEMLRADAWVSSIRTPRALNRMIDSFYKFIKHEFDSGRAPLYYVVNLHNLTKSLYDLATSRGLDELAQATVGVHVETGRLISNAEEAMHDWLSSDFDTLYLVSNSDQNYTELNEIGRFLTARSETASFVIRPPNSPLIMEIFSAFDSVVVILSLLFLTRLNFEIVGPSSPSESRMLSKPEDKALTTSTDRRLTISLEKGKFSMTAGIFGEKLVHLCVEIDLAMIKKIRSNIAKILRDLDE